MRLQNPAGLHEKWRYPNDLKAPAFRMIGNIHYVGNLDVSSHLIAGSQGHVLIDTGFATTVPLLLESIRSLGFHERDIELILITHGHVDHAGGARRMAQATGAPVALHRRDVQTVETGSELTCAYFTYGIEDFETFKVDRVLRGGETLRLGDVIVRVHHTPGHTPGVCSYEIPVEHGGKRLTACLFGGPGQWTFKKENRSQGYEGDLAEYRRSLDYLQGMKVDIPLGAHPGQVRTFQKYEAMKSNPRGQNPFIDPGHWPSFLGRLRENLASSSS